MKSWLADFLGFGSSAKKGDLAARTGLKVVLDAKGNNHGSPS